MVSFLLLAAMAAAAPVPRGPDPATYTVRLVRVTPPKLTVSASLPLEGQTLDMDTTRPGLIPELDAGGWPALVSNLKVSDAKGKPVELTPAGDKGWRLAQPYSGRLKVTYDVDYQALAARNWPAPREAAITDANTIVLVCRSIFITTHQIHSSRVTFALPQDQTWRPVTPWQVRGDTGREFAVADAPDLFENLVVLTRTAPDVVNAGRFRLLVVSMGQWQSAREEVRRVLGGVVPRLVGLMGVDTRENYLVVLLPVVEHGGESFRHSFALTSDVPPSRANSAIWGNTIAHEIFHLWNGWLLRGTEYFTTQWFQEGFTEYAANVSMVSSKLITPDEFLQKLAVHVADYLKLKSTLEGAGSHKGPPLYGGGALVAFCWDIQIRNATQDKRSLWDFMNALYQGTDHGMKTYAWPQIQIALDATAEHDWDSFFRSYIWGSEPLPLGEVLPLAGLRPDQGADGSPRIVVDPAASEASKALWQALLRGR